MKIITLDIGGTSIKSGEVNGSALLSNTEYSTNARAGGESVMLRAEEIISGYQGFDRIGISTAGQVDSSRGVIRFANGNIPHYTGMRVKERMEARFHVPVAVENDVNAAAVGEAHYGAGMDFSDFLCLTYGTGVGGAIVIDKKVYTGSTFSAGEFGHIITHAHGERCNCGANGCYERYASVSALVRHAKELNPALENGRLIFTHMDDPAIKELVDGWIDEIALGLVSLIHTFNPACVVMGGGIMNEKYIIDTLKTSLYNTIMPSYANVEIRQARLRNTAGLLGAAYLAEQL